MVVGYHHFRKPPCMAWNMLEHFFVSGLHCKPYLCTMLAINCLRSASTWKCAHAKARQARSTKDLQLPIWFSFQFVSSTFLWTKLLLEKRTNSFQHKTSSLLRCLRHLNWRTGLNQRESHQGRASGSRVARRTSMCDVWSEKCFLGHNLTYYVYCICIYVENMRKWLLLLCYLYIM